VGKSGQAKVEKVAEFFVSFMKNDHIANAHLTLAEARDECTRSEPCLKLAVLHSTAVNFAKTDVPVDAAKGMGRPDYIGRSQDNTFRLASVAAPSGET
jgi:hypothetical protein